MSDTPLERQVQDHRGASIHVGQRVQIAQTPAGPRGTVIALGTADGVLVRWQSGRELWETGTAIEVSS